MKKVVSQKKEGVEAVDRALSVLRAFDAGHCEMTLTDLAARTGLYKSTVLRLTASLEAGGCLVRGEDRVYRLGPELWRLGSIYRRGVDIDLGEFIRPALRRIVDATTETASFYVRDGEERICLYRINSPRAVRHHLDEGQRLPLALGAAGRVLRAYTEPDWPGGTGIRKRGECISLGERDPEVGAAAVPVLDREGKLRGALTVSGILSRFGKPAQAAALDALKSAASELGATLPPAD